MKKAVLIVLSLIVVSFSLSTAADYSGKKVLFIDSYHEGYAWSDGVTEGVKQGFDNSGVELKIVRMDTKRNGDVAFKKQAALKAKAAIEAFKPDVVIASDDNASKFLIMPYFKNAALPFVFCGVNWDASVYGYPYKNATGMIEVSPIPQLIEQLQPFAKGKKIGYISVDILTEKKEVANWDKAFGIKAESIFAKNFEEWKKGFKEIQDKADIVIVGSDGGLYKGKEAEMKAFAEANTKKPTGSSYDFMSDYAMISFAKVAQEQGSWSAEAALKILSGTSPADIPIVKNQEGQLIINTRIAKSLGAELSFELIETAAKVIE
jgi:ABC-type uncharacterized transport system substrate-binding protein